MQAKVNNLAASNTSSAQQIVFSSTEKLNIST